jgi:hypothetical protein
MAGASEVAMSIGRKLLQIALVAGAGVLASVSTGQSQEDPCAASNKRQACSYQCCGRRSCPPSCEVDCVKACVDACASPARLQAYTARKRELQVRCGNKSVR